MVELMRRQTIMDELSTRGVEGVRAVADAAQSAGKVATATEQWSAALTKNGTPSGKGPVTTPSAATLVAAELLEDSEELLQKAGWLGRGLQACMHAEGCIGRTACMADSLGDCERGRDRPAGCGRDGP